MLRSLVGSEMCIRDRAYIAQGVLAHILGRLLCPKKIPRKIGNSMLAQCQYRMKIRKAENIAESSAALRKICKDRHKLANCDAVRTHHNGKIVAEASTALQHQTRLAPQSHHTLRNSEGAITFRPHHKPGHSACKHLNSESSCACRHLNAENSCACKHLSSKSAGACKHLGSKSSCACRHLDSESSCACRYLNAKSSCACKHLNAKSSCACKHLSSKSSSACRHRS